MDLSKFSTEDLKAMQTGDLQKMSTEGLRMMQSQQAPAAGPDLAAAKAMKNKVENEMTMGQLINQYNPILRLGDAARRGMQDVGDTVQNLWTGGASKPTNDAGKVLYDREQDSVPNFLPGIDTAGRMAGQYVATAPLTAGSGAAIGLVGKAAGAFPRVAEVLNKLGNATRFSGGSTGAPAATSIAGKAGDLGIRAAGGALSGGIQAGAIDPESAGLGAGIGGAIPVAGAAAGAAGQFVGNTARLMTPGGRQTIAEDAVRRSVADPSGAAANLQDPVLSTYMAPPTGTQAVRDAGISRLEDYLANKSSEFNGMLKSRMGAQNTQRFTGLQNLGGSQQAIDGAVRDREAITAPLLKILEADYQTPVGTQLPASVINAFKMRPEGSIPRARTEMNVAAQNFYDDAGNIKPQSTVAEMWGTRRGIDDVMQGKYQGAPLQGGKAAAANSLGEMRDAVTTELRNASPAFGSYSDEYAKMSAPVQGNRAMYDVVKDISRGVVDQNGTPMLSAPALDRTLKNAPELVHKELMPNQADALIKLRQELLNNEMSKSLGMGGNSATAQRMGYADELPFGMKMLNMIPGGRAMQTAVNMASLGAREGINSRAGNILLDPAALQAVLAAAPKQPVLNPELQRILSSTAGRGLTVAPANQFSSQQ